MLSIIPNITSSETSIFVKILHRITATITFNLPMPIMSRLVFMQFKFKFTLKGKSYECTGKPGT